MSTARQRLTMLAAGVAVAALASTSGAVAAGMITGDDIKNNTVRSSDIKNGTLKQRDLKSGLKALIRAPGPQGEQGEQGERGAVGPRGPAGETGPAGPTANVDALTARVEALEGKIGDLLIAANCAYDFPAEKMWEVTWGYDFANRDGGETLFDIDSYGGLVSVNGDTDKPDELRGYAADWRWLYPTAPVTHKVWVYEFDDGTEITATVDPDANGCPVIVWSGIPTP